MGEVYTYYYPNEKPQIISGPLQGRGRAWVRGSYPPPDYPSPLNVRVGEAGIKAWTVIEWLQLADNDEAKILEGYGRIIEREDVEAARWVYQQYAKEIDHRIAQELEPV